MDDKEQNENPDLEQKKEEHMQDTPGHTYSYGRADTEDLRQNAVKGVLDTSLPYSYGQTDYSTENMSCRPDSTAGEISSRADGMTEETSDGLKEDAGRRLDSVSEDRKQDSDGVSEEIGIQMGQADGYGQLRPDGCSRLESDGCAQLQSDGYEQLHRTAAFEQQSGGYQQTTQTDAGQNGGEYPYYDQQQDSAAPGYSQSVLRQDIAGPGYSQSGVHPDHEHPQSGTQRTDGDSESGTQYSDGYQQNTYPQSGTQYGGGYRQNTYPQYGSRGQYGAQEQDAYRQSDPSGAQQADAYRQSGTQSEYQQYGAQQADAYRQSGTQSEYQQYGARQADAYRQSGTQQKNMYQQYGNNQKPEFYQRAGMYQQYGQYQKPGESSGNGFGIASMILGILSLMLFCTCINIPLAIAAVIFGILQLGKKSSGRGTAVTGIVTAVLSVIALIVSLVLLWGPFMAYYGDELINRYPDYNYRDYYDDSDNYDDLFEFFRDFELDGYSAPHSSRQTDDMQYQYGVKKHYALQNRHGRVQPDKCYRTGTEGYGRINIIESVRRDTAGAFTG